MEMFTSFQKVMADPDITTAGKSVFLNLLSRMDKKGYCYPAVNTMEKEIGFCERTIQRQTNALAEKGYIVKAEQKAMGKQFTNRYYLTPEEQREFFFNDNDIKQWIQEEEVFQEFLKKEEVIVSIEYKYLCLQILYRSMKMNKYEKLLLGYLIMRADKEAFTYFSIERLAATLRIPFYKTRRALKTLIYRKLLHISQKIIHGECVMFVRICLEEFNLGQFVKRCYRVIRHVYNMTQIRIEHFMVEVEMINTWKVLKKKYCDNQILRKLQQIQELDRHVLI